MLQLPPSKLQLPPSALLFDDLSASQALELARRDGRAVTHSPQAAAVQLYTVINAQTDVVKSQVDLSIVHTWIGHSQLRESSTLASLIHICISHHQLHQSLSFASAILACIRPALMTCTVDAERPDEKVEGPVPIAKMHL